MFQDQPVVRVPDQERIRAAKKKRALQLQKWNEYDKKMEKKVPPPANSQQANQFRRNVRFDQHLVLLEAASRGDLEEVYRMLREGVCPDVANEDGLTALHQCCIDNNKELCQLLLRYHANVNARDSEQWTPLHAAATCGQEEICQLLIDNGADLLALNGDGNMPYDICEHESTLYLIESAMANQKISQDDIDNKRRVPECEMLRRAEEMRLAGMDLNQLDNQGASMLHIAAASGFVDVASSLLNWNAKIDVLDKDGWRPIHVAACWGQYEVIELLTHYGEDLNVTTPKGETIFELCGEDDQFRQQLYQLQDELEKRNLKLQHSHNPSKNNKILRRRSSNNPRGSSIRRSSMRQKNELSRKEAQQENAGMLLALENQNGGSAPNQQNGFPNQDMPMSPVSPHEKYSQPSKPGSLPRGPPQRDPPQRDPAPFHSPTAVQPPPQPRQTPHHQFAPTSFPPANSRPANEGRGGVAVPELPQRATNGRLPQHSPYPSSPPMSPVYAQPSQPPSSDAYYAGSLNRGTRGGPVYGQPNGNPYGTYYRGAAPAQHTNYSQPRMLGPNTTRPSGPMISGDRRGSSNVNSTRKPQQVKPMMPSTHPRRLINSDEEMKGKQQASGKCCVVM
ncbi:hypothetical protein Ciccas_005943 [Cichlidogyrus casuarinus]|uniref:Uncharacterized protein n=1 Tax=Cichlidogyrus casuarinus TaxID=1844966 RepID=A0ABD2Q777_9PLAT